MSKNLNLEGLSTEAPSNHNNLEKKSLSEILQGINQEDKTIPFAVEKAIPQIEALVSEIVERMKNGGRLFYIGAGTSGRLGILDASECPPTYGVPPTMVVGIIAGGDFAIRNAVENAEDDPQQAWKDLSEYNIGPNDSVVGIAASGRTPYVEGGLNDANKNGLLTGCIVCNENSPVATEAQYPVEVVVGPEYVTGSTRMKSGTAQKLVLNMISTSIMIKLGKVKGNIMVDMQLSNDKLVERGTRMIMKESGVDYNTAKNLLLKYGNVRKALAQIQLSAT
ncbi:MAG: N-acetylmuramic acid 6-phosphate etherase [Cytophagaceae bacterium]|nr:N-acetylmuramic acid 6-phosphate etherase [Cytophagaceae bacterium]MBK9935093.1 N-acetylmuramic acid 6-phosphate etherase [Cytophagaceae bacterium]MBL0301535.1 N-acetylmuramic acid 6-phosphate etherase [Cytophagaceae bacterium]MBL0324357.1 N-acetylmuramic acid 6-phosphate etherase [Cytophagaceae bacterium]